MAVLSDVRLRVRGGGGMTRNYAGGLGLAFVSTCLPPSLRSTGRALGPVEEELIAAGELPAVGARLVAVRNGSL